MGTITMSFEKEDEERIRRLAKERYGGRKGSMSKVVVEGVSKLEGESKKEKSKRELIELMRKGIYMGGIKIKHRSELYDRRIFG